MKPKYPSVKVKLVGNDGNAFSIISRVSTAMKRAGISADHVDEYMKEAMIGDYDNVLCTTMKYVDVS